MTIKARSIHAITLARTSPVEYQITYWDDGVARFDGRSGQRQGAWDASLDIRWFASAAKVARSLQAGHRGSGEAPATIILDTDDGRLSYDASGQDEPPEFWTLSTLMDGMCQRISWLPLDTQGHEDFARFGSGTPIWMSTSGAVGTGFGFDGQVLVLAGAQVNSTTTNSLEGAYKEQRTALMENGGLISGGVDFRLARHVLFPSPSAAASVLAGSNTSGRRAWRNAGGVAWS